MPVFAFRRLAGPWGLGPLVATGVVVTTLALPQGMAWARERRAQARRAVAVQAASEPFVAKQASVVVQAGDTLWDLCQRYTGKPWVWPQVWALNPQLTNPHWLEAGSVIHFEAAAKAAVGASQVAVAHAMDAGQGDDGTSPAQGNAQGTRAAAAGTQAQATEAGTDAGVAAAGALGTAQAAARAAVQAAAQTVAQAAGGQPGAGPAAGYAASAPSRTDEPSAAAGAPGVPRAQGPGYVSTDGQLERLAVDRTRGPERALAAASSRPSLRSALWPTLAVRKLAKIASLLGERPMALRGERVAVQAADSKAPLRAGELYAVVAIEGAVKGLGVAEGGQMLGVRGVVRVVGDGMRAEAELLHISAEVEAGLLLAPLAAFQVDGKEADRPAPEGFAGQILALEGDALVTGGHQLAFLGAGSRDGLAPGMRLWLVEQRPQPVGRGQPAPAVAGPIGEMRVVHVQAGHATCAVLRTRHEVGRGQWAVAPVAEP